MSEVQWFCRNAEEWDAMAERLKLIPCPHCKVVGTLNRHGCLYGYDENNRKQKTVRARRVFCSNRNARPGCGRTLSVWGANKIRRLSLTSRGLWRFLTCALAGSVLAACRAVCCHLSHRTLQRIWKRFGQGQCKIRTALSALCLPCQVSAIPSHHPAAQVLAHLQAAFPGADCPIAAFQHTLSTFFI